MYIFYYLNSFKEITCKFNMPLTNNLIYESSLGELKKEIEVAIFLDELRFDIFIVENDSIKSEKLKLKSKKEMLKIIEKGEYKILNETSNVDYLVDLSKAQSLIKDYRSKSEGGCQSCINLEKHYEDNETYRYCNVGENKDFAINSLDEVSPKVEKYFEKGCEDRKPIFSKTIEQILEEAN